jgi:CRISPR-associated protein Csb1
MSQIQSNANVQLDSFDHLLRADSDIAAIVGRQYFVPAEGKDAVIFPPTYAPPEGREEGGGYNIDKLSDGHNVCLLDSVPSQANRIEPLFKTPPYKALVPQIVVKVGSKQINLLDAGHRTADAVVRFSGLKDELRKAFQQIRDFGNAEPLAKIAPTSILHGVWDSRGTQVKLQRIVRSVIRAYDVETLHRSSQYIPPVRYVDEGIFQEPQSKAEKERLSQEGFLDSPATFQLGGVLVKGDIRRDIALNLVAIRALAAGDGPDGSRTLTLRRYILGLALVAITAPIDTNLREGCLLVVDAERPSYFELVSYDGIRQKLELDHATALAFAQHAASAFGVDQQECEVIFDKDDAQKVLSQTKEEAKRQRRQSTRSEEGA